MADMSFKLIIMNAETTIYEGEVSSAFFSGDKGEFELLPHHAPAIGVLQEGDIVIDGTKTLYVTSGIVRFYNNECLVLAEQKKE